MRRSADAAGSEFITRLNMIRPQYLDYQAATYPKPGEQHACGVLTDAGTRTSIVRAARLVTPTVTTGRVIRYNP